MSIFHVNRASVIGLFSAFLLLFSASVSWAQPDGKALFTNNCASCHHPVKDGTGPALQGAVQRWKDAGEGDFIYEWVNNNGALRNSGKSKRANQIFKDWGGALMSNFALAPEEIDAILAYADGYVAPPPPEVAQAEEGEEAGFNWMWWSLLAVILLVVAFAASGVRKKLQQVQEVQEGTYQEDERTAMEKLGGWIYKNWLFALVIFIVLLFGGIADTFFKLYQVGVYQDYMPSQEVAYDHSLHAGEMEIDCRYCHNSVEKSKHAGLPTTNVCMNCHKMVHETAAGTGAEEIAKLHKAAGYNKDKKDYNRDKNGEIIEGDPIVWNKAHNLPDHVFFSHKQHVKVGGVDCIQCHGDVKTYTLGRVSTVDEINELAKENSEIIELSKPLLTMGWCIECHDKKGIDVGPDASNPYYQEIHERLKLRPEIYANIKAEDGEVTVKELGGWECAKCHY